MMLRCRSGWLDQYEGQSWDLAIGYPSFIAIKRETKKTPVLWSYTSLNPDFDHIKSVPKLTNFT